MGASSGRAEALEPQLRTRMLTFIFVFKCDFGAILDRFWEVLDFEIRFFAQFFRKRRFCENHAPVDAKLLFLRFRASRKPREIQAKSCSRKGCKKVTPKSGFFLIWGSFWTALGGLKFKTLALGLSKNSPKSVQDDPKVDFGASLGRIFFRRWFWGGF